MSEATTKGGDDNLPRAPTAPTSDTNPLLALQEMGYDVGDLTNDQIKNRIKMLENNIRVMKSETQRLKHQHKAAEERVNENKEKIKLNKQLPYLVANVVEILDVTKEDQEEEQSEAAMDEYVRKKDADKEMDKCVVVKTSTRQTIFLPIPGLVDTKELHPNDLVGVNKDSYLILDKLPAEYDSRVKAMEVDEKPQEDYNDVGGLDKQIEELVEAVVLPILHKERFDAIGIQPPKGIQFYNLLLALRSFSLYSLAYAQ